MKAHTSEFKEQIKTLGRELDSIVSFNNTELGGEQLNSVIPHYEGGLLKSVMKQLDIDSNVEINVGDVINYKLGIKVNDKYEYLNFGNYIVNKVEKQEDFNSYMITCYDKMLYSMKDYEKLNISYPISIRDYITAICNHLGINFKNKNETFANYDKMIQNELYLSENNNSLGYTFRDVFDELAQATASTICINDNDELEIRYINDTQDTIDEEFLRDVNVNFGKKYGKVNSIVLSRSSGSDNVYLRDEASVSENGLTELKISDNQIMNWNDRSDYLPDILEKINGLEYYLNDFTSIGVCYYDLCDKYNVKIGDNIYPCIMLNDEINITQGLVEEVFTEELEISETDYTKSDKTDRKINQAYLIIDKQNGVIQGVVEKTEQIEQDTTLTKQSTGNPITIEDAGPYDLESIAIDGKSVQDGTPTPTAPIEIKNVEGVTNYFDGIVTNELVNNDGTINSNASWSLSEYIEVEPNEIRTFSRELGAGQSLIISEYDENKVFIKRNVQGSLATNYPYIITTSATTKYVRLNYNNTYGNDLFMFTKDINADYVPYGRWLEVKSTGKNLCNGINQNYFLNIACNNAGIITGDTGLAIPTNGATKMTISTQITQTRYRVACVNELPTGSVGVTAYNGLNRDGKNQSMTIDTTGYTYLIVNATDLTKIQVEEGSTNTEIEDYKKTTALVDMNKKNLFNKNNATEGYFLQDTGATATNEEWFYSDYIEIDSNEIYTLYAKDIILGYNPSYCFYDKDKTYISGVKYLNAKKLTITAPTNAKYIRISVYYNVLDIIKLYKGLEIDDYYSFAEDGVFKDSRYTQTRTKITLTGDENWVIDNLVDNCTMYSFFTTKYSSMLQPEITCMSNYLEDKGSDVYYKDVIGIYVNWGGAIRIKVGSEITTLDQLKTWLSEHPLEVECTLKTPIEHNLNYEILELHEGYNNITTNDDLEPNMSITYLTDSKMNAQYATKAELNIESDNIRQSVSGEIKELDKKTEASLELKVNQKDLASEINAIADLIKLVSSKLVIETDKFKLAEGVMKAIGGTIGNIEIGENYLRIPIKVKVKITEELISEVFNRIVNGDTFTDEEIRKYDLNKDGKVTLIDTGFMGFAMQFNITPKNPGYIEILSNGFLSQIAIIGGDGVARTKIDLSGIKTNGLTVDDTDVKEMVKNQTFEFGDQTLNPNTNVTITLSNIGLDGYEAVGIIMIDTNNNNISIQKYSVFGTNAYITFRNTTGSSQTFNGKAKILYQIN